jgi:uncharacterized protein YkwD
LQRVTRITLPDDPADVVSTAPLQSQVILMKRLLLTLALVAVPSFATEITRESVLAAMNQHRLEENLPPLREDARLEAAAEDRMRDMEERSYWAHQSPDGRSPFRWLALHGYDLRAAGENLASGFESTELLTSGWMESAGHRHNIMSSEFADCGIAIIDGSTKGRAAGRSVVVLFGRDQSFSAAATRPRNRP